MGPFLARTRLSGHDRLPLHFLVLGLKTQERPGAEEAVAADAFSADDAFEQERPVSFLDLAEGADRRQGVADQLPIDGHHAGAGRQGNKFIETGMVAHGRSRSSSIVNSVDGGSRGKRGPDKYCLRT